ncbi:MAG: PAS domain S-box protein [Acidimicrobiia bacterium]
MSTQTARAELDGLFNRLPAALYRTSVDGHVLAANRATAELLGYDSVEDLLAIENVAERSYVEPWRRHEWRRVIEAEGTVRDFKVRLRRLDGRVIWARDTARAVYDDKGEVRFYEGVLVDVTAEVEASNASSVLSGVLEATSDMVTVFDDSGRLRYANGASRAFLGLTPQQVAARPSIDELLPSADWQRLVDTTRGEGWSGELVVSDKSGRACPLWVVVTVHDGRDDRRYVAASARDLTHMKQTQERLEELLTAKDVVVATVSHELRHPLTGVMGLAEELRDRFEEFGPEERRDLITLIAHEAAEMTSLVDDLLVAVRSDVGEVAIAPENVDVISHLLSMAATIEAPIDWQLPDRALEARVDPHRFRQIVRNVLSNAQRYGGGDVRITARAAEGMIMVEVSDGGEGVAQGDAERIFEPYQRGESAPPKQGSVGLGLSVARRLARLMGGDLEYLRTDDRTVFRLTVPAADGFVLPTG